MMFNTIDMRVVLIGAVALVVAFYEGSGEAARTTDTPATIRPALVRCAPPADADLATVHAGDITGSIRPATHTDATPAPAALPTCR